MNREIRVLRKYFDSLCRAISDPLQLAGDLQGEGIISEDEYSELRVSWTGGADDGEEEGPRTQRQRAAVKMLSAVDQSIAKDASIMSSLIQVLKENLNDNGRAYEAVRSMEVDLNGGGATDDFISIQHARKIMVKHMNNIAAVITDAGRIADSLHDQGIITERSLDDIKQSLPESNGLGHDKSALASISRLLMSVESQVGRDPGKFPVLIAVLKDDPSTDQNVIALLEAEYYHSLN
uniref:Uncharacterized protein n=1 Tax=Amphimedon queenslandica TaxID=400682 RepID=A0A1X7V698_AMPQE